MIVIFNAFIAGLGNILTSIFSILPNSPFSFVTSNLDSGFLKYMNYLFPVATVVSHLQAYVLSVAVYYGVRVVLRWIKAAGS